MPPSIPCPDAPVLRQLLCGLLPLPDGEALLDHLSACDRCAEYARTFRADDPLSAAVRGAAAGAPDDPSVAGLVAELTRRGPPAGADDPGPTALSLTTPPFGGDTGCDDFDFLAPAEAPDEIGRLGGYRILKVLGSGGMGVVFRAEDPALQRPVALKAMRPGLAGGAAARRRFLDEARAAAALHHDHVVAIFQVGEERGVPFLVMPLLHGESLEDRLRRVGPLPAAEVCRVGREVARGLEAAHARGLVHRDVKPANVWLEAVGDEAVKGRAKILDFGLALSAGGAAESAVAGTPAYMAPEQAAGRPVDGRADLFALGCLLYHAATGAPPFRGPTAAAVLAAVAKENPPPPASVNPAVPPALSALVMRLLAKDPAGRPASAREAAEALGKAEAAARRRLPWRRWALCGVVAVLLLGAAAATAARVIVPTDRGEVTIETDDPDVAIVVKGERIVRINDPKTGRSYQLDRDDLTLTRTDDPDGLAVTLDGATPVVLKRNGHKMATLRLAAKPPDPPPEKAGEVRRYTEGLEAPEWRPRVAFTADGREVYATSDDYPKALLRWDRNTGALLSRFDLPSRQGGGIGFAMSPDRRLMVMRHGDDELWVARAPGDVVLNRFEGVGEVWSSAVSARGDRVAAGNNKGNVFVWDRSSGKRLWLKHTDQRAVLGLAFSPDGATLVVGGNGRGLQLLETETGKEVSRLAHNGCESAFSKDGKRIVTASWTEVLIYDQVAGKVVQRITGLNALLEALAVAPDELHLATGGPDGMVRWWDVNTGAEVCHFYAHPGGVLGVAVAPDGKYLLSGGKDGTVRLWRLPDANPAPKAAEKAPPRDPDEVRRFEGHTDWVCNALFHPDGRRVLSSSTDGTVRLWDQESGDCLRAYGNLHGHVWGLALSADGKTVAASCINAADGAKNAVRLWDVDTGGLRREIPTPCGAPTVDLSADGRLLVGGEDGVARVFDVGSGRELCRFAEHTGNIRVVLFSKDCRYAFSASHDQSVRMWDPRTGKEVRRFIGHMGWVLALALSPDGRYLLSGGDRTVQMWEVETGRRVRCFEGHPGYVLSVAFSPDGRRILSGDFDNRLRLWNVETGRVLLDRTCGGTVEAVRFSSDGRRVLFGGNDNLLRLWCLPD